MNIYCKQSIKLRISEGVGHVARMGQMRIMYKILVEKVKGRGDLRYLKEDVETLLAGRNGK
jgi:hypothetical protein